MQTEEKFIYIALLGAALGDALPTVADSLYFTQQQKLKRQLSKQEITPSQYWKREAAWYYSVNSVYWALIALILYNIKGDYHKKLKVGLWILGGSAVLGVLYKNIKKDEADLLLDSRSGLDKNELREINNLPPR